VSPIDVFVSEIKNFLIGKNSPRLHDCSKGFGSKGKDMEFQG